MGVRAYVAETPALPFSLGVIYRELTAADPRTRLPALVANCETWPGASGSS
jgi:type IV secretion system protein VirD4